MSDGLIELPVLSDDQGGCDFVFEARDRLGELRWIVSAAGRIGLVAGVAGAASAIPLSQAARAFEQAATPRSSGEGPVELLAARAMGTSDDVVWAGLGEEDPLMLEFLGGSVGVVSVGLLSGGIYVFRLEHRGLETYLLSPDSGPSLDTRGLAVSTRPFNLRRAKQRRRPRVSLPWRKKNVSVYKLGR